LPLLVRPRKVNLGRIWQSFLKIDQEVMLTGSNNEIFGQAAEL
jgi:hypothetical protein